MNTNEQDEYKNPLMSNDFDIVELFSQDESDFSEDLPLPTYDSSGFPRAKHRNHTDFALSKPQDYDECVLKPLEEMTVQEVKQAQEYLYQKLGKEMCDFIKERKLKRMNETQSSDLTDNDLKIDNTHVASANELIFKFDKKEFLKYQWMSPSESNQNEQTTGNFELSLHELRFGFEGFPIRNSEDVKSYESTLYNHGLDSEKPGYTLPELLHLLQSSFKPQVQISIKALSNILFNSYSPNRSKSDFEGAMGDVQTCFSYSAHRWNRYIEGDLDLTTKLGYSICENQLTTIILIDSLRCLSLLTFGDSLRWNRPDSLEECFVLPVQEVLFDYYQFYSGVDIYYWNSLHLDLLETNVHGSGEVDDSKGSLKRFLGVKLSVNKEFYEKLLTGLYQSYTNEDILREMFVNIDFSDSEDVELESKLYLLCKHNIIHKLLLIMKRYRDNVKVQIYCTSVICGFIVSFGTPLANALIELKLFKEHFESVLNVLITQAGSHYVHLNGLVLYLVMLLSVYLDFIPYYFTSFISLIKETLTRTFSKQLRSLNMIDCYSDDDEKYTSYASIAIKCLTVWAVRGYLFDALDEFVPLFNLSAYKMGKLGTSGGMNSGGNDNGPLSSFDSMEIALDHEIFYVLAAINLQFSSCLRLNNMHAHFKANEVIYKVKELMETFGTHKSLDRHDAYYLYSLLQLLYDYVDGVSGPEDYEQFALSPTSLLKILEAVLESFSFEFPEGLLGLKWFDESVFTGSRCCLYRRDLIKEDFDKFILPFNILSLILNVLMKLGFEDGRYHSGNGGEDGHGYCESEGLKAIKQRLFELGDHLVKGLKTVYFKFHKSRLFYLNATAYIVKSIPVFESCLVYLRSLVTLGYDSSKVVLATLALSVDYNRLEDVLNLPYNREDVGFHDSTNLSEDRVLAQFRDFNEYIASYSLGSDRLPLVSMLSYLSYLPLNFSKQNEIGLGDDLMCKYGSYFVDWVNSEFMFAQLVYTINSSSEDLTVNLPIQRYGVFQKLLFGKLSISVPVSTKCNLDRASVDIVNKWVQHVSAFKFVLNSNEFANEISNKSKLTEYFDSVDSMATNCSKLISKFNSGRCDSPVTVGLMMLFTSHWSNEECSKLLWSDESLMLLIGRNLTLDFDSCELKSTLLSDFTIGSVFTFTFAPESVVKSQTKILALFSDESVKMNDPVLFLTILSLVNHSVDLSSLGTQSALIRLILDGLSS